MGKAAAYGDEWLGNESVGKRENEIATSLLGIRWSQLQNQTGTTTQLKEDGISHFVRCILKGLRQAHAKPLNYGKVANIEQE